MKGATMRNALVKLDGGNAEHVFDFCGHKLRARLTPEGVVWFLAADVCEALGIDDVAQACSRLDQDEVSDDVASKQPIPCTVRSAEKGGRKPLWITESGLYTLAITSRKPQAKPFRRWVTHEVLPEIVRRGYYSVLETELQKQKAQLLEEFFPSLPGPSKRLAAELIGEVLGRFGWAPASGRKVPALRGNPPWAPQLASWLYRWSCRIEGQQAHRRAKNPAERGSDGRLRVSASKSDQGMLSDVAESAFREVCRTGCHFVKISASWEDWRTKMELAFGTKPVQLSMMVPLRALLEGRQ